jgi:hypothetical protein
VGLQIYMPAPCILVVIHSNSHDIVYTVAQYFLMKALFSTLSDAGVNQQPGPPADEQQADPPIGAANNNPAAAGAAAALPVTRAAGGAAN